MEGQGLAGGRWSLPIFTRSEQKIKKQETIRCAESETYQSKGIGNLADQDLERLDAFLLAKLVAAVFFKAPLGLVGRQTNLDVGLQFAENVIDGQGVGRRRHGFVGLPGDMILQLFLLRILFLAHGRG